MNKFSAARAFLCPDFVERFCSRAKTSFSDVGKEFDLESAGETKTGRDDIHLRFDLTKGIPVELFCLCINTDNRFSMFLNIMLPSIKPSEANNSFCTIRYSRLH